MKRLFSNLESTTPLVNSDFNDILQEQHKIAYSAYLDGLNDMPYTPTQSSNRGIILSGIEIDATLTDPTKLSVLMNWSVTINKSTALIYFDGEYYSPSDNLLGIDPTTNEIIENFSGVSSLMFYPFTQSIRRTSSNEVYRSSNRSFNDGINKSMTIDYRFDILAGNYTSLNEDRLVSTTNLFRGATQGLPYVFCHAGGTSRNLSRLLRYANAVKDDIYISHTPKRYRITAPTSTLVDEFLYRDFAWTQSQSGGQTLTKTVFELGRNELKGFAGLTAMAGRFMVGYDRNSSTSPQNAGLLQFNYRTPGNIGGTQGVTFSFSQLPTHTHGTLTGKATQNLDHSHPFNGAMPVFVDPVNIVFDEDNDTTTRREVEGLLNTDNSYTNTQSPEQFLTRSVPISDNPPQLKDHYHEISSVGQDIPHENRPPYTVVVYYYKI